MIKISEFLNGYNMARDKAKYIDGSQFVIDAGLLTV